MEINAKTIGLLTHDLKGPIGNLSMFAEILNTLLIQQKEKGATDLDQAIWYSSYINMISSKYIDQLQNWSDYINLVENKLDLSLKAVNLQLLMSEVLQSNKIITQKKSISLQENYTCENSVIADHDLLRRILDNLIQLFILLMPNKSLLKLNIEQCSANEIELEIGGLQTNDTKLFETLFMQQIQLTQSDVFEKGLIKTTGIGLAFCGEAIRKMNGEPILKTDSTNLSVGFKIPCVA